MWLTAATVVSKLTPNPIPRRAQHQIISVKDRNSIVNVGFHAFHSAQSRVRSILARGKKAEK
jgi:hypothetical protein